MKNRSKVITILFILLWGFPCFVYGAKEFPNNKGKSVIVGKCDGTGECVMLYSSNTNDGDSPSVEFETIRLEEERAEVTIKHSFVMGKYEVTQRQWFDVMDENPSYFKEKKYCGDFVESKNRYVEIKNRKGEKVGMCPNHPVEMVSWSDTMEFFRRLNKREGNSGCGGNSRAKGCWRLPTEAEWEYAARSGATSRQFFGENEKDLGKYAWYYKNSNRQTHAVGTKEAGPKGIHDMHGNVWEWMMDKDTEELLGGGDDPLPQVGPIPVIRGGGWRSDAWVFRSVDRNLRWDERSHGIGFRPVRTEGP